MFLLALALAVADSGFIAVPGGRLFYQESGRGPAVVLLHDGLLDHSTWTHQIEPFAAHFRVIRYDRRGAGQSVSTAERYSDLDDLRAVLDSLHVDRATLIGCSAGGGLALDFTLANPRRVAALVLVGPVVSGFDYSEHFRHRGYLNYRGLFERDDLARAIDAWVADPWFVSALNPEAKAFLRAGLTRHPASLRSAGPGSSPPPRPALAHLGEISVPTLLVVGAGDIPDVHAHVGAIDAGIRSAERVVIDSSGHLPHLERPAAFNATVLSFLRPAEEAAAWVAIGASDSLAERGRALTRYDPSAPLDVREASSRLRSGARVRDLTFAGFGGSRVPAFLVEPATKGPRRAGIVWVHHGQGDRRTFLDEAISLARRGTVSLLLDAPDIRPESRIEGRKAWDPVIDQRERALAIIEIRRAFDLLLSRPDVDPGRLGYVGYSLGATIGAGLAGIETRPAGFVLMAGFSGLAHTTETGHIPTSIAFRGLLSPEAQRTWIDSMAPLDGVHHIGRSRADFLLQFATRDEYISRFDAEAVVAGVKSTKKVEWYQTDHFGLGQVSRAARVRWLARRLGLPAAR